MKTTFQRKLQEKTRDTLYDPSFEKDSCGTGFVANISGKPTHEIVEKGIEAVVHLTHRGATDADAKTGDGAGILVQVSKKFFKKELETLGHPKIEIDSLAVGMIFFPRKNYQSRERARTIIENVLSHNKIRVVSWRMVPVDSSVLGEKAEATRPEIEQALVFPKTKKSFPTPEHYERALYLARKEIEKKVDEESIENFYIPSFSSRTLVYKGLFVASQLKKFYLDLNDPDFESALALFHQRYSTNTFPTWFLAQPFRFLGHNGEINTLPGNRNWMKAREAEFGHPFWNRKIDFLKPVIVPGGSDSAALDNLLELLVLSGRGVLHSMMMLVPEAWENMPHMDPDWKAFYQYHSCMQEPWDGPAALAFTDGQIIAAVLDRNGLRPARYIVTNDGMILMGSEVGVIDIPDENVKEKGRLGPGKLIAVDLVQGKLMHDEEVKAAIVHRSPYSKWLKKNLYHLPTGSLDGNGKLKDDVTLLQKEIAFGYTFEELAMVIKPMVLDAKDPVGSMGDDTPLAVLSNRPRRLSNYFKQLFAQVTNPPIDPIREELVMSLHTLLGKRGNILEEIEAHAKLIQLDSPLLFNQDLKRLRSIEDPEFRSHTITCLFDVSEGKEGLEAAIDRITEEAIEAVRGGKTLLILSDCGVNSKNIAVPMTLAVGAVHHHLIREGLRMRTSIILETGEPNEIHHFALLLGYGADAVNPYLAFEIVESFIHSGEIKLEREKALKNYGKAVEQGILKIMSKMGISTLSSYRGAQIFEAIGLSRPLVERCFSGTPSRVGGIDFQLIAQDQLTWHDQAFGPGPRTVLDQGGFYRYRQEGEYHAANPGVVSLLQRAAKSGDPAAYDEYAKAVNSRPATYLRDLLEFKSSRKPIPLEEVESMEDIRKRFCTPGISHGALSRETHEALAVAMNRIGGKSNSGEGGEDPLRYKQRANGDWANSKIKQVASGRFGVTPEYLMSAEEFEIKMAQGSKPGEGGQLPGHKVSVEIATIRHSIPGITLISPPPHHDIYSIEDLAQLIYDLKMINPKAKVCVKLVSAAGVGTVAAGCVKAHADVVQVSGCEGGTGASPLSSIKNAGMPWELGLSEAQQVLVLNDLRGKVILRTDGGLKTGRDIVIAGLLGAEEFGFGTASLIAAGCAMIRACHLNTCPVGVATQNEKLRAKFTGTPEAIINFFNGIANEVRAILANLGYRRFEEIIGRTNLLHDSHSYPHEKAKTLDLSALLANPDPHGKKPRYHTQDRNNWEGGEPLDPQLLKDAAEAIEGKRKFSGNYEIRNIHRTVGGRVAGRIAQLHGDKGLAPGFIEFKFKGTAGQSFGAWCIHGLRMVLVGQSNDYVGKGMSGGEIIVRPSDAAKFSWHQNVIIGNTVMYGATGGTLYAAGQAGERFCVRNSGASAVIEGAGDHFLEYMTGGTVLCLGEVGRNAGAGMTGGVGFVLDEKGNFPKKYNSQLVGIVRFEKEEDEKLVKSMIQKHLEYTQSPRAKEILDQWKKYAPLFWKIEPSPTETKIRTEVVVNVNRDDAGRPVQMKDLLKPVKGK